MSRNFKPYKCILRAEFDRLVLLLFVQLHFNTSYIGARVSGSTTARLRSLRLRVAAFKNSMV